MVKGTTRQVVVVKVSDTDMFEQAIFLLKEESLEKHGITEAQLLEEARKLSERPLEKKGHRRGVHGLPPLAWSGIGAGLTGLAWLLFTVI